MNLSKDVFLGGVLSYIEPNDFVNLLCVSKSVFAAARQFQLFAELDKLGFYSKHCAGTKLEYSLLHNNYLWMKYYTAEKFQLISDYKYPDIFRKANFSTLQFLSKNLHIKTFSKNLTKISNVNLVIKVFNKCGFHDYEKYLKYLCSIKNPPEQIIDFCLNDKPSLSLGGGGNNDELTKSRIVAILKGCVASSNTVMFDKYYRVAKCDEQLNEFMISALNNEELTMARHLFNKYIYTRADIIYVINNTQFTSVSQLSFLLNTYTHIYDYNSLLSKFIQISQPEICLFVITLAQMQGAHLYPASVHEVALMIDSVDMIRKIDFIEPDNGLYLACKAEALSCIRYYLESGATNIEEMIGVHETNSKIISILLQFRSTRKRLKISVY